MLQEEMFINENKMRNIILEQVKPVIVLSKENMITNCLKNDELKMTRDDM